MTAEQRTVRVFVDDAVLGRFPRVCAATGRPSDGWTTVRSIVGRAGVPGVGWLLLLLGPLGWGVLFVWCVLGTQGESLDVELPWTEAVHDEVEAQRRRRSRAWLVAAAGGVCTVFVLAAGAGPTSMATTVLGAAAAVTAVVAVGVALAASWKVERRWPTVHLDASRRWVTLGNVDPVFVRAVAADQAARSQPR